jgi:ribonucleoside-diphosphate reductase alpha chain
MHLSYGLCLLLPYLSNGGTDRGLPISCFLNYVPDSRQGLGEHYLENIWLSSSGGGIGGYWGDIRSQDQSTSKGNKTTGVIPFMHVVDSQMVAFQSRLNKTRFICKLYGHITSRNYRVYRNEKA